jgi:hypothetical protein
VVLEVRGRLARRHLLLVVLVVAVLRLLLLR